MEVSTLEPMFREAFPFWQKLSDRDKYNLCHSTFEIKFDKGTLIHDGNECTGIIFIRSGSLRLYMLSEEGKEITLYRLFAGDLCILSASCAIQNLTFDVFIDAEENSDCVIIGGCVYAELSERIPEVKIFTLETAMSRFSDVMWVMQQILFMSMDRRLAIFLLDETAKNGTDTVTLSHEQIAKYMGSAREVVSRMLKYFATEGMVEVSRRGVKLLDKKRIRALT